MKRSAPITAAVVLTISFLTACGSSPSTTADAATAPTEWAGLADAPACEALREKHPDLVGQTLTNALNPHTPGYETINPSNPNEYEGFDIDLGNAIGSCLGFTVDYLPVGFAELIPTVASGRADWILSNLYATEERAKGGVDFVSYAKVFDGILVKTGNPKGLTGIDTSLCGSTVALNKGYVEVPLVEGLASECEAKGLPAATVSLFDSSADCVQAVLSGRADAYMNDVNTVLRFIAQHPDKLASAETVMLDYEIGIGIPQGQHDLREAVVGALTEIQGQGIQQKLAAKWELTESEDAEPTVLSAN